MYNPTYVKLRKKLVELIYKMVSMKPEDIIKSLEEMVLIAKESKKANKPVNVKAKAANEFVEPKDVVLKKEPVEKKEKRKYNTVKGQD